jgi:hypothetical protein
MIDQSILDDNRYQDIARLVLDDDAVETDPDKSVVAQPRVLSKGSIPKWRFPDWFEPLQPYCEALLDEHPDFAKNVFVMMKFDKENEDLNEIYGTIKEILPLYDLNVLRADERYYTDQLWDNVRTYMLCCSYGVAVLENIVANEFNPNVGLEYGFMSALNRPTMVLVDDRFRNMRADIIGTIVYPFNSRRIGETVAEAVRDWAQIRLGLSVPGD